MGSMKLPRRRFLQLATGAAALAVGSRPAWTQTYPARPVRFLVGFAAGGPTDIAARLMGQWLSERLRQQFVIENRPGAGSNIATEAVVRAPPDGHTLLLVGASAAINATLYRNLSFNFLRDIAPVASMFRVPLVMEVNPSFPARTVPEFLAYARANPGKLNLASGGNGTPAHVSGELFKMMTGIDMIHVPYRGDSAAVTDLLGGQVQVMFPAMSASVEYIKAGKLRALAVTTTTRSEVLPDVPTLGDYVPGYEVERLVRHRRAAGHARGDRRQAQHRDQCPAGRAAGQGAAGRARRDAAARLARRFRPAHRGRDREVGQGGQVLRRQAGVTGRVPRMSRSADVAFRKACPCPARLRSGSCAGWRAS